MSTSREQFKLALQQRKEAEKKARDEAVKQFVASDPRSLQKTVDFQLRELEAKQKIISSEAQAEATAAEEATENALKLKREADEKNKLQQRLNAKKTEEIAQNARAETIEEIKVAEKERIDKDSKQRKEARREAKKELQAKLYAKEQYKFRIISSADAKKTLPRPLPREYVYLKNGDFSHTLITIDLYEVNGCIAYRLISPIPNLNASIEVIDRVTNLKTSIDYDNLLKGEEDELLKEQILYAISQDGFIKKESEKKRKRARLDDDAHENRMRIFYEKRLEQEKEHHEKKLRQEEETNLKWALELEPQLELEFKKQTKDKLLTLCLTYQEHLSEGNLGYLGCLGVVLLYIFCWDNSGKKNIINRLTGILKDNTIDDTEKLRSFTDQFTAETEAALAPRRTRWFWSLFCPASSSSDGVSFAKEVKEIQQEYKAKFEAKIC